MRPLRMEIEPGVFRIIPAPSTEYEWRERQQVLTRDWSRVHTTADKRQPLTVWVQARRTWAK